MLERGGKDDSNIFDTGTGRMGLPLSEMGRLWVEEVAVWETRSEMSYQT